MLDVTFIHFSIFVDDDSSVMPGMYLRAFCSGMYDSLEPYRSCLISLEKEVLENPDFTLSGILAHVSGFSPLFTTLNSVINKVSGIKNLFIFS